jgi:hypothetical protein
MTRTINLSQGAVALVDDEDYERLSERGSWHLDGYGKNFYAVRNFWTPDRKCRKERMHRLLLPGARIVDHINGDTLDNRKANLREANDFTSAQNRGKRSDSKLPYKGISRNPASWGASIQINGVRTPLGSFPTPEDAARVYDAAAVLHFGEFARTNFTQEKTA